MKETKMIIDEQYKDALAGFRRGAAYVQKLKSEGDSQDTLLVFMFSDDLEINRATLKYLPMFCEQNMVAKVMLISPFYLEERDILNQHDGQFEFVMCTDEQMYDFCRFFAAYREYDPAYTRAGVIINGSPFPEDRRIEDVIGFRGITPDEYVAYAVYRYSVMPEVEDTTVVNKKIVDRAKIDWESVAEASVKDFEEGRAIYNRIREEYPKEMIYLVPYPGTGDMYLIGMYIADRMQYDGADNGIMAVASGSCEKIYSLMETGASIESIINLGSRKNIVKLLRFAKLVGYDETGVVMINDAFDLIDVGKLRGYKGLDFNTLFQKTVFHAKEKRQQVMLRQKDASFLYAVNDLKIGNVVVLAPYTKSMMSIEMTFWELLAQKLTDQGYDVVTNTSSEEAPIKGTKALMIPYDSILDFLNKAKAFIGIRSGLCDVISWSSAKKIVLYHSHIEPNTTSSIGFFGLSNMEIGRQPLLEIETDGKDVNVITDILGYLGG